MFKQNWWFLKKKNFKDILSAFNALIPSHTVNKYRPLCYMLQVYDAKDPFLSRLYCVKTDHNNAILVGSSEYSRCVLFDARNRSSHVQVCIGLVQIFNIITNLKICWLKPCHMYRIYWSPCSSFIVIINRTHGYSEWPV